MYQWFGVKNELEGELWQDSVQAKKQAERACSDGRKAAAALSGSKFSLRWCRLVLSGISAAKEELHFKLSFLVELCSWNTPRIANVLLWQAGFRGWQTALFSFRVLLSALIEIFCHGLEADAKQGCWPPCVCLSLSTFIQTGPRAAGKRIRGVEKEINKKEERELFLSHDAPLIRHEGSEKPTPQISSLILVWWSLTGLFPVSNIPHDRLSI